MKKALSLLLCALLPVLLFAACGQPADNRTPEELFYALPVSAGITDALDESPLTELFASGQPLRMEMDFSLDKCVIPMEADLSGSSISYFMDVSPQANIRGNMSVNVMDEKISCDLLSDGGSIYAKSEQIGDKWLCLPMAELFAQTGFDPYDLSSASASPLNTQLLERVESLLTGALEAALEALQAYPLATEQVTVSCGGLEETGTAVTLELTAAQLVTPLTAVMTYLRDSSDAYNLVVELSGEAVTQDEYRETLDDAIAEMNESAAEMPAATFRLTRTFKDGRQLSAAFEVTVEGEFTLTGEMITLNPSSKKSAFSLDVRAEAQGLALMTLTAEGSRSGSEQTVTAALAAEDADVSLSYMEKKGSIDASLKIADGYGDGIRGAFTLQGTELNASLTPLENGKAQSALLTLTGKVQRDDSSFDADLTLSVNADGMRISIPLQLQMKQSNNGLQMRFSTSLQMPGTLDFALSGSFSIVKIDDFTVEAPSDVYTPEETEDILNGDLPLTGLPSFDF